MKTGKIEIGERIRAIRKAAKMNQAALGDLLGVGVSSVSGYESGDSYPNPESLARIAEVGDVTLGWLVTGEGTGPGEDKGRSQTSDQPNTYGTTLDKELLKEIVIFVEETAEELKLKLIPEKKAQLLIALYEMFAEEGKKVEKETVLRLIKLAA